MTELFYSRKLNGFQGTYVEVLKKKHIFSKLYYVFNLFVGGKHKIKESIDFSKSEYSLEYVNEKVRIYANFFKIIEYPLHINVSDELKKGLINFRTSKLFKDIFRGYSYAWDAWDFKRTQQGFVIERNEDYIKGIPLGFDYIFILKRENDKTWIKCQYRYTDEKCQDYYINIDQSIANNISDFILCILKTMFYYKIFYMRKEDKYFSYPTNNDYIKFGLDDYQRAADFLLYTFDEQNSAWLFPEMSIEHKYEKIPFFAYPFSIRKM